MGNYNRNLDGKAHRYIIVVYFYKNISSSAPLECQLNGVELSSRNLEIYPDVVPRRYNALLIPPLIYHFRMSLQAQLYM